MVNDDSEAVYEGQEHVICYLKLSGGKDVMMLVEKANAQIPRIPLPETAQECPHPQDVDPIYLSEFAKAHNLVGHCGLQRIARRLRRRARIAILLGPMRGSSHASDVRINAKDIIEGNGFVGVQYLVKQGRQFRARREIGGQAEGVKECGQVRALEKQGDTDTDRVQGSGRLKRNWRSGWSADVCASLDDRNGGWGTSVLRTRRVDFTGRQIQASGEEVRIIEDDV